MTNFFPHFRLLSLMCSVCLFSSYCVNVKTKCVITNGSLCKYSLPCVVYSCSTVQVDFSQSSRVLRDYLTRRYGLRHSSHYGLQYTGRGKSCVTAICAVCSCWCTWQNYPSTLCSVSKCCTCFSKSSFAIITVIPNHQYERIKIFVYMYSMLVCKQLLASLLSPTPSQV